AIVVSACLHYFPTRRSSDLVILYIKKVKGAILIGILSTWLLGIICQAAGIYIPNAKAGYGTLFPNVSMTDFRKLGETFGQCFNRSEEHTSELQSRFDLVCRL